MKALTVVAGLLVGAVILGAINSVFMDPTDYASRDAQTHAMISIHDRV